MSFQIHSLPRAKFESLFSMTDNELAAHHARRVEVTEFPASPCRPD